MRYINICKTQCRTQQGKKKTCPKECLGHVKVKVIANAVNRSILDLHEWLNLERQHTKKKTKKKSCVILKFCVRWIQRQPRKREGRGRPLPWLFHGITLLSASSSQPLSSHPSHPSAKMAMLSSATDPTSLPAPTDYDASRPIGDAIARRTALTHPMNHPTVRH